MMRLAAVAFMVMLLSACSPATHRPVMSGDRVPGVQLQREAWLAQRPNWSFTGRIAVSDQGDGGSGRIEWIQRENSFEISLHAPVTRRSWRLLAEPGLARLEGLEGGPFYADDAGQLLHEHLGWTVPLADLADWVRGLRARAGGHMAYTAAGVPAQLEQDGWLVDYREFEHVGAVLMPVRVFAARDSQRIRLKVDTWTFPDGQ